jgi:hypothetical protein
MHKKAIHIIYLLAYQISTSSHKHSFLILYFYIQSILVTYFTIQLFTSSIYIHEIYNNFLSIEFSISNMLTNWVLHNPIDKYYNIENALLILGSYAPFYSENKF